jgi:hypothetical protein
MQEECLSLLSHGNIAYPWLFIEVTSMEKGIFIPTKFFRPVIFFTKFNAMGEIK